MTDEENDKKICFFITGKQKSGKSTLRKTIIQVAGSLGINADSFRFSDALYTVHNAIIDEGRQVGDIFPLINGLGDSNPDKRYKDGTILQRVGDLMRELLGSDILIKGAEKEIRERMSKGHKWWLEALVIEDGRLAEEFDRVKATSEKEGVEFFSINLVCPEDIRKERALAAGPTVWRPNTSHRTEIGLEGYRSIFDKTFDTSQVTIEEMRKVIYDLLLERFPSRIPAHFEYLARHFTDQLRDLERTTGCGANFRWDYDADGKKCLSVTDVASLVPPSKERLEWAKTEVPGIIEKATKELVNDDPGRA